MPDVLPSFSFITLSAFCTDSTRLNHSEDINQTNIQWSFTVTLNLNTPKQHFYWTLFLMMIYHHTNLWSLVAKEALVQKIYIYSKNSSNFHYIIISPRTLTFSIWCLAHDLNHHSKFGSNGLCGSEDVFWIKPEHMDRQLRTVFQNALLISLYMVQKQTTTKAKKR